MDPGMSGQFGVGGKLDALVGGFGGHSGGIGDEQRHDKFAPVAHNHSVEDIRTGLERVFNRLWGNEFASGGLEQILFAVGDKKIVVFVHVTDVSGTEPAIFAENFAGGFGIFEVALHDAGAFYENFAVLGHADLNVRNRFAGTAHAIRRVVAGDDRRSFGETIALIDRNANGPEEFREIFGKRRAAGRDDAQLSPGANADFLVNQSIGEFPLGFQSKTCVGSCGAPGSCSTGHVHGPIKNHSLDAGGFRALFDEARIDFFEEARDGGNDGGMDFEQGLGYGFNGFDVSQSGALKDVDVVQSTAVDVGERKE